MAGLLSLGTLSAPAQLRSAAGAGGGALPEEEGGLRDGASLLLGPAPLCSVFCSARSRLVVAIQG